MVHEVCADIQVGVKGGAQDHHKGTGKLFYACVISKCKCKQAAILITDGEKMYQ